MPLASLHAPFDHHDWIFELKYDGLRALGYIDSGQCWLVSRRGTAYQSFPQLCAAIGAAIPGQAVLDSEIVHLDVMYRVILSYLERLPGAIKEFTGKDGKPEMHCI